MDSLVGKDFYSGSLKVNAVLFLMALPCLALMLLGGLVGWGAIYAQFGMSPWVIFVCYSVVRYVISLWWIHLMFIGSVWAYSNWDQFHFRQPDHTKTKFGPVFFLMITGIVPILYSVALFLRPYVLLWR